MNNKLNPKNPKNYAIKKYNKIFVKSKILLYNLHKNYNILSKNLVNNC